MAAPLRELDDLSDLDDDLVEVGPRVAWLLRMARLTSAIGQHGGPPTQTEMVDLLVRSGCPANATAVSRAESGSRRLGMIVDGYEAVLGLPTGQLRAPVDILCRTFSNAPTDGAPDARHLHGCGGHTRSDVTTAVSRASDRIRTDGCTGGEWLAWARSLTCDQAAGFPTWLLDEWLDRLVSELSRSVGHAFAARYESVSLLRCGPYGDRVLAAAERWVADPHVQVLFDVMSAVGERPEPQVLRWCCDLLRDARPPVVHGAVVALDNMTVVPGLTAADWDGALEDIVEAYARSEPGSEVHASLSKLLATLPRRQRRMAARACRERQLTPLVRPRRLAPKGEKSRANPHWAVAESLAAAVTDDLGLDRQPVLERLLFEVVFEHRETRAVTSLLLLAALPFCDTVARHLAEYARSTAPEDQRRSIWERLMVMQNGRTVPLMLDRPDDHDPDAVFDHVTLCAQSGGHVERTDLDTLFRTGGRHRRRAFYAAGLSGHPWLHEMAASGQSEDVRGPARWWLTHGSRVADHPVGHRSVADTPQ